MYTLRRGLGDVMPLNTADVELCSGGMYWFFPPCWAYSKAAWEQAAAFKVSNIATMPVSPAAIPAAYTSTSPTTEEAAQQVNDVLTAAALKTQANNLAASQNQETVCDSGKVLADDGTCVAAPCTLLGFECWKAGLVVLAAVLGVSALASGRPARYGR